MDNYYKVRALVIRYLIITVIGLKTEENKVINYEIITKSAEVEDCLEGT